jgi:hypothetical protein
MKILKPENEELDLMSPVSVFLAGSIEMGKAVDWQSEIATRFEDFDCTFYNPRRDSWDSSWEQKQSSRNFNHQVNWEISHLEECDLIFMNFVPETKSPISLLELGLFARYDKMIVCCPKEFWRSGNVEIVCSIFNVPIFYDFEDAVGALETKIRQIYRKNNSK